MIESASTSVSFDPSFFADGFSFGLGIFLPYFVFGVLLEAYRNFHDRN